MSLQTKIETKLNEALKAQDKKTYPTLRLVIAAIKDTIIAKKITPNNNSNVDVHSEVYFKNSYNARYVRIYPQEDTVNNKHTGLSVAILLETNSSFTKTGFIGYDKNDIYISS